MEDLSQSKRSKEELAAEGQKHLVDTIQAAYLILHSMNDELCNPLPPSSGDALDDARFRYKHSVALLRDVLSHISSASTQIEITCRGQQLQPILTLQQVRDNIWSPREAPTLLPHSSTTDHIMVLHYARRTPSLE